MIMIMMSDGAPYIFTYGRFLRRNQKSIRRLGAEPQPYIFTYGRFLRRNQKSIRRLGDATPSY